MFLLIREADDSDLMISIDYLFAVVNYTFLRN